MSTLQLGGESINLACAQYMIFLDRDWSPKNMLQAVGRIYRPGQTGIAEIIYIDAINSIDRRMKGCWKSRVIGSSKCSVRRSQKRMAITEVERLQHGSTNWKVYYTI